MIHFSHGCSSASDKHFPIFRVPGTAGFFNSVFCTWAVWWSSFCWTLGGDFVGSACILKKKKFFCKGLIYVVCRVSGKVNGTRSTQRRAGI